MRKFLALLMVVCLYAVVTAGCARGGILGIDTTEGPPGGVLGQSGGSVSAATPSPDAPLQRTEFMLNTVVTITIFEGGDAEALNAAVRLCADLEAQLSRTRPGSDVYRINHAGGAPVKVGEACAALLREGVRYGGLSGGALDITVEPLSSLWDFSAETPRVPNARDIEAALAKVDFRKIQIGDDNTVTLPSGMGIDLGAVAKGYIADRIADLLRDHGVSSALINLGGNVLAVGGKPGDGGPGDGKPDGGTWRVGVKLPFGENGELAGVARVAGMSVVTSGSYERGFQSGGAWYHHILDTRTGYPAGSGLDSVTIISRQSLEGDALSTACFVMGAREGMALIESLPGVEAVFITQDNREILSSGILSGETRYESLLSAAE